MANVKIFAIFCVISVALSTVLSSPAPPKRFAQKEVNEVGLTRDRPQHFLAVKDAVITPLAVSSERDWLSDFIYYILGIGVGELLSSVNTTLEQLNSLITLGVSQLQQVLSQVDPATQQEIQQIINSAHDEAIEFITPLLEKLGLVLPTITFTPSGPAPKDAADLIQAILHMSLEEFLNEIAGALLHSDELLVSKIKELKTIADRVTNKEVAEYLHNTSDQCLDKGRSVIGPMLDSLEKVLTTKLFQTKIDLDDPKMV